MGELAAATLLCAACGPRWDTDDRVAPQTTLSTLSTPAPTATSTTIVPTTALVVATTPGASTSTAPSTTATTVLITATTSSSSPPQTSTTQDASATIAAITANWVKFFASTSSIDDRVALLEDGESLRAALEQRAQDPLMGQATATVDDVELSGPTQATVTYDVLLSGAVALPKAQGTAVLQDGVWKVGAASFCALVSLGATAPIPGC